MWHTLSIPSGDWTDGAHSMLHHTPPCCPTPHGTTIPSLQHRRSSSATTTTDACKLQQQQQQQQHPAARIGAVPSAAAPLPSPLSDAGISRLRHHARRAALLLEPHAAGGGQQGMDVDGGAEQQGAGQGGGGLQCPVLLVRRRYGKALAGWSVIVPAGWATPFWTALSFTGGVRQLGCGGEQCAGGASSYCGAHVVMRAPSNHTMPTKLTMLSRHGCVLQWKGCAQVGNPAALPSPPPPPASTHKHTCPALRLPHPGTLAIILWAHRSPLSSLNNTLPGDPCLNQHPHQRTQTLAPPWLAARSRSPPAPTPEPAAPHAHVFKTTICCLL